MAVAPGPPGSEGVGYLRRAIELAPHDRSAGQARLLTGLALVLDTAAPLDLEYDAATRALELATEAGDDGLRALCLSLAAVGACYTDFDQAWVLAEQAAAAAPGEGGMTRTSARALQALILHHRDQHDDADALCDEIVPGGSIGASPPRGRDSRPSARWLRGTWSGPGGWPPMRSGSPTAR